MSVQRTVLVEMDGPKGHAEVVEVFQDGSNSPEYEVVFNGQTQVFQAEGAACIEAESLVGNA